MVQSPSWAANWFAASQVIPYNSRNPKVHYRTHKRPPPVSILGQPNPVHIPTYHLLEIHPNIIHPSTPRPPQWSLSLRFPHQDPIHTPLSSPIRATCPAHLILLDFITSTMLGEEYKSFRSAYTNFCKFHMSNILCHKTAPGFAVLWGKFAVNLFRVSPNVLSVPSMAQCITCMCFVWIWEQTANISLYSINWLIFYNRDRVCLLRGMDWIGSYSG